MYKFPVEDDKEAELNSSMNVRYDFMTRKNVPVTGLEIEMSCTLIHVHLFTLHYKHEGEAVPAFAVYVKCWEELGAA